MQTNPQITGLYWLSVGIWLATSCAFAQVTAADGLPNIRKAPASNERVALLIGNSNYGAEQLNLNSPSHDVNDVKLAIQEGLGFQQVIVHENLDRKQMVDALLSAQETVGDGVVFFYYSGHAVSFNGENYLIPINATVKRLEDIPLEAVSVTQVLSTFQSTRLRIIVLDACRNNPFGFGRKGGGAPGLTRDRIDGIGGTLIAYAAAPGTVAYDGPPGASSPYTSALVRWIGEPDVDLPNLFINVRGELAALTANEGGGPQRSEEVSSLTPEDRLSFLSPVTLGGPKQGKVLKPNTKQRFRPLKKTPELMNPVFAAPWITAGASVLTAGIGATLMAVSGGPIFEYGAAFYQLTTGDASLSSEHRRTLAIEGNAAAQRVNSGLGFLFVGGSALVIVGTFGAAVSTATGAGLWLLSE